MISRSVVVSCIALFILTGMQTAWPQESRGTIIGRVTDSSGSVVPAASVRITNIATGVSVPVVTNESGNYSAPFLTPGMYRITAEETGFKRIASRFNGIRSDGINYWDMSLMKNTNMTEEVKLELRVEALNALNRMTFNTPNVTPTSTAFGTITSERAYPRRVQITLRVQFQP